MEIVTMILSGLALLAASVCLILLIQEKKRNQKRNTAALQYAGIEIPGFPKDAADIVIGQFAGILGLRHRRSPSFLVSFPRSSGNMWIGIAFLKEKCYTI